MSDIAAAAAAIRTAMPPWPENPTMKRYSGSCHCKKFQFQVEHPVFEERSFPITTCNCSFCVNKALLMIYTTSDRFHFTSGSWEEATAYRFNRGIIAHLFCSVCGVQFAERGKNTIGVNVRSLERIDLETLEMKAFDGKNVL